MKQKLDDIEATKFVKNIWSFHLKTNQWWDASSQVCWKYSEFSTWSKYLMWNNKPSLNNWNVQLHANLWWDASSKVCQKHYSEFSSLSNLWWDASSHICQKHSEFSTQSEYMMRCKYSSLLKIFVLFNSKQLFDEIQAAKFVKNIRNDYFKSNLWWNSSSQL